MLKAHVKLKLVVKEESEFLGVFAMEDLKYPRFVGEIGCCVQQGEPDSMRPSDTLEALYYVDLDQATIGDVVTFLQDCKRQHSLVVDKALHQIRGLISVSDVARKPRVKIQPGHTSSFAELYLSLQS